MDGTSRFRTLLLGGTLLATLVAAVWVSGRGGDEAVAPVLPARTGEAAAPSAERGADDEPMPQLRLPAREAASGEVVDLFPRQSWYVPPPAAAPRAPPLPFAYIGKMADGAQVVVFVHAGDRNFSVRDGDVIDGTYRVDRIEPPTMTVTYLPLNQKQTLDIGRVK